MARFLGQCLLFALILVCAGCGTLGPYKLYDGPERAPEDVSVLLEIDNSVIIYEVDGKKGDRYFPGSHAKNEKWIYGDGWVNRPVEIRLLPGHHTIKIGFYTSVVISRSDNISTMGNYWTPEPRVLEFSTLPGRRYRIVSNFVQEESRWDPQVVEDRGPRTRKGRD